MLSIGLTGGIGCGKSTVTNLFNKLGVPVIDADEIAHQLVRPGETALQIIAEQFGDDFLLASGELNRDKLRLHIYNSPNNKKKLEAILHPLVFERMQQKLDTLDSAYAILSIPLLFETGFQDSVDHIVVIDCDESKQIERVKQRDKLSNEDIKYIISSQCSRHTRLEKADDIINNNGSIDRLSKQVEKLHEKFLNISTGIKDRNPSK